MSQCSLLHNRRWVRQQEMRLCAVTEGMTVCTGGQFIVSAGRTLPRRWPSIETLLHQCELFIGLFL